MVAGLDAETGDFLFAGHPPTTADLLHKVAFNPKEIGLVQHWNVR